MRDLVEGHKARRDVPALETRDGRLRRPDPLREFTLAETLLLPKGADLGGKANGAVALLVATATPRTTRACSLDVLPTRALGHSSSSSAMWPSAIQLPQVIAAMLWAFMRAPVARWRAFDLLSMRSPRKPGSRSRGPSRASAKRTKTSRRTPAT